MAAWKTAVRTAFGRGTYALALAAAAAAVLPEPLGAQMSPTRLRVLGDDLPGGLGEVEAVLLREGTVAVLSGTPAVHLFEGARRRAWGGGSRPVLRSPVAAQWSDGALVVHDVGLGALVTLDGAGRVTATRRLPSQVMGRLHLLRRDTLMSLGSFRSDEAAIVRLRGGGLDTLVRYRLPGTVRLEAAGSPSYTVPPPFAASPAWALLSDGTIAFWDGRSRDLALLDRSGRRTGALPLPAGSYPVRPADRELWLRREIPREFMGRRVFEPLRAKARRELPFPARFPPVLELLADPRGGVWVRRRPASSGELWARVGGGGAPLLLSLPPGRELLAVGAAELAARYRREDGTDVVEMYARPAPGPGGR